MRAHMRVHTGTYIILFFLVILFCGCVSQPEARIEYQCWDGTIVTDILDCPPTTSVKRTSTTSTTSTTTLPCPWTEETCSIYCSQECGFKPLEYCRVNATTCLCEFKCNTTTTSTTSATSTLSTTSTTLRSWLSEKDIDESINWGEENRFNLSRMLGTYAYPNYTVGYEHIIVYTPYLNLALEAASKAREYRKLNDSEIEMIVAEEGVRFKVKLYGNSADFAEDIKAIIKLRGEVIHPTKTILDDSPETTAYWPDSPAYFAVNTYCFEDYGKIRDRTIKFIIIKFTGEQEYTIDMTNYP